MSTFMAHACVDLHAGLPADPVLQALNEELDTDQVLDTEITTAFDGGRRLLLVADGGDMWLGSLLSRVARRTGDRIARMIIALNHDEYGAENAVPAVRDGEPVVVHHVYVHPRDPNGAPVLEAFPAFGGFALDGRTETTNPDGILDGPRARGRAAELFGVPPTAMETTALRAENAHRNLCLTFAPHAHWWEALDVQWPTP